MKLKYGEKLVDIEYIDDGKIKKETLKTIDEKDRHRIGEITKNFGIQTMQTQEYLVTSKSVNLIKELRTYSWDKDKNGQKLNKPVDKFNHAIDAVRYHEMESIGMAREVTFFGFE